jgi:hypothetical protein
MSVRKRLGHWRRKSFLKNEGCGALEGCSSRSLCSSNLHSQSNLLPTVQREPVVNNWAKHLLESILLSSQGHMLTKRTLSGQARALLGSRVAQSAIQAQAASTTSSITWSRQTQVKRVVYERWSLPLFPPQSHWMTAPLHTPVCTTAAQCRSRHWYQL